MIMSQKLFVGLFLVLFLAVTSSAECSTNEDILEKYFEAKYATIYYRAEVRVVGMNAIIRYLDDDGSGISELESIRDDFVNEMKNAKSTAEKMDDDAFDASINEGGKTIASFRETLHKLVKDEDILRVRTALDRGLMDESEHLQLLREDAANTRKTHILSAFDFRICILEGYLDKIEARGYDISELKSELNVLEGRRIDIEANLNNFQNDCVGDWFGNCDKKAWKDYRYLKTSLNEDFSELRGKFIESIKKKTFEKAVDRGLNHFSTIEERLEKYKSNGGDVDEYLIELSQLTKTLNSAKEDVSVGDFENAKTKINELKEDIKVFREKLRIERETRIKEIRDGKEKGKTI